MSAHVSPVPRDLCSPVRDAILARLENGPATREQLVRELFVPRASAVSALRQLVAFGCIRVSRTERATNGCQAYVYEVVP